MSGTTTALLKVEQSSPPATGSTHDFEATFDMFCGIVIDTSVSAGVPQHFIDGRVRPRLAAEGADWTKPSLAGHPQEIDWTLDFPMQRGDNTLIPVRLMAFSGGLLALVAVGCAAGSASGTSQTGTGGPVTGGGASPGTGGASSGFGGSIGTGTGGSTGTCLTDACVPVLATSAIWAVQVDPPSSSPYAATQVVSRDVSKDASFVHRRGGAGDRHIFAAGSRRIGSGRPRTCC